MTTPILGMDEMVEAQANPYLIFNAAIRTLEAAIGGAVGAQVINISAETTIATPDNAGNYTRFTHASPVYVFDDGEGYVTNAEYHGRNAGVGSLVIEESTGMTVNPPFGGTLVIPPGGTFTVKIVAADEADLFGVTEASS